MDTQSRQKFREARTRLNVSARDYNSLMYPSILFVHSWLRWVVILLGLAATFRAIGGMRARRSWTAADDRAGRFFMIALDTQLLLGLVLYFFLSPITKAAMSDFGGAMKVSAVRFWALEHWFGMIIGIALVHAGVARARRTTDGPRKHRIVAVFFVLALIAILASIPWPGMPSSRPLVRW